MPDMDFIKQGPNLDKYPGSDEEDDFSYGMEVKDSSFKFKKNFQSDHYNIDHMMGNMNLNESKPFTKNSYLVIFFNLGLFPRRESI
jgi:hypothetical protein